MLRPFPLYHSLASALAPAIQSSPARRPSRRRREPAALFPGLKPWCSLFSRVARQVPSSVPSFVFFFCLSQGSLVPAVDKTGDNPQTTSASQRSLFSSTQCLVSAKKAKTKFLHRGTGIEPRLLLEPPSLPPAAPRSPAAAPRAAQDRCLATPFFLFQTHQICVRRPCAGALLEITSDSREQIAEAKEDVIDPRERL